MRPIAVLLLLFPLLLPAPVTAFDWRYEGRFRLASSGIWDLPPGLTHHDTEVELRNGLYGNLWRKEDYNLDYEFTFDLLYTGGAREQAGLSEEYDAEIFRGWLRLEKSDVKVRVGRQQILFGAGMLYRPLGFFDTRIISGIIPLTRGVDGLRATYFTGSTSLLEGWAVPGKQDSHVVYGLRGERQWGSLEVGAVAQYHPVTDLEFLPSFNQELVQVGYHLKGEKEIGFWNESRMDIEINKPGNPVRFDTVLGVDYTFNVGQGLHALVEYFLTVQDTNFTLLDPKGDRLIQQVGVQLDQPVGIDIIWRVFMFYDLKDRSFQFAPQIEYNLMRQVYLYFQLQLGGSIDGDNTTGRLFTQSYRFTGTESRAGISLVAYF